MDAIAELKDRRRQAESECEQLTRLAAEGQPLEPGRIQDVTHAAGWTLQQFEDRVIHHQTRRKAKAKHAKADALEKNELPQLAAASRKAGDAVERLRERHREEMEQAMRDLRTASDADSSCSQRIREMRRSAVETLNATAPPELQREIDEITRQADALRQERGRLQTALLTLTDYRRPDPQQIERIDAQLAQLEKRSRELAALKLST